MKSLHRTLACAALLSSAIAADPPKTYTRSEAIAIANWARDQKKQPAVTPGNLRIFGDKQQFTKQDVAQLIDTAPKPDPEPKGFLANLKVRQDYQDVLKSEDPSNAAKAKAKRDQLSGATFGFSRDYRTQHDDLTIKGALIYPIPLIRDTSAERRHVDQFHLKSLDFIPSVTLNKFEGADEDKEVDSLIFRAGFAPHFDSYSNGRNLGLDARGFVTYGTDTDFHSRIIAGEFDLEPLSWEDVMEGGENRFNLGYETGLFFDSGAAASKPGKADAPGDKFHMTYSIRTYLHGEFGEVTRNDKNKDVEEGGFFRLGPVVKLGFKPCSFSRMLGMGTEGLSIIASYSWLPDVNGRDLARDELLSAGLEVTPFPSGSEQKLSIKLLYEYGGLDLSKQKVDALTLGMGVTF